MKQEDMITQFLIFLSSIVTVAYSVFSTESTNFKRKILIGKFLGAILVSFFIIPAIMEYFALSIKSVLFLTVIIVYGLEELLKASVRKLTNTISKDEKSSTDN